MKFFINSKTRIDKTRFNFVLNGIKRLKEKLIFFKFMPLNAVNQSLINFNYYEYYYSPC